MVIPYKLVAESFGALRVEDPHHSPGSHDEPYERRSPRIILRHWN